MTLRKKLPRGAFAAHADPAGDMVLLCGANGDLHELMVLSAEGQESAHVLVDSQDLYRLYMLAQEHETEQTGRPVPERPWTTTTGPAVGHEEEVESVVG